MRFRGISALPAFSLFLASPLIVEPERDPIVEFAMSEPNSNEVAAPKKVFLVSLGCPKNLVDSEVFMGDICSHGYQVTDTPRDRRHSDGQHLWLHRQRQGRVHR